MSTCAERILNVLRTADRPLTQPEIAQRTGDLNASVRRVVQDLESRMKIRYSHMEGHSPTFFVAETGRRIR